MASPVYITGAGIVSAIGVGKGETLESLLAGKSGISEVKYLKTEHTEFPVGEVKLSNDEMSAMLDISNDAVKTRTSLMAMLAVREALNEAGIEAEYPAGGDARDCIDLGKEFCSKGVASEGKGGRVGRVAFINGTTVGGMDMSEQFYLNFVNDNTKNEYISVHDCGACSEMIADYFGGFGSVTTLSTACSSAANAILFGAGLIRSGRADIVVAGGCECLTKFHLNGFNSLMILDKAPCRPFDETRAGLNLGEGAAYIVMESESSAMAMGKAPIALLSGVGNACDAFHQTASSPNGEGAYLSMSKALSDAGLKPVDIDYINAHGTGTPNNDASESAAMARLFGDHVPAVSSTKSFTGHTTSASGAIEAVICLMAMQNSFIPANLNWRVQMENGISPVKETLLKRPLGNVLCNSFGFGGNDSSLIFTAVPKLGLSTATPEGYADGDSTADTATTD